MIRTNIRGSRRASPPAAGHRKPPTRPAAPAGAARPAGGKAAGARYKGPSQRSLVQPSVEAVGGDSARAVKRGTYAAKFTSEAAKCTALGSGPLTPTGADRGPP